MRCKGKESFLQRCCCNFLLGKSHPLPLSVWRGERCVGIPSVYGSFTGWSHSLCSLTDCALRSGHSRSVFQLSHLFQQRVLFRSFIITLLLLYECVSAFLLLCLYTARFRLHRCIALSSRQQLTCLQQESVQHDPLS